MSREAKSAAVVAAIFAVIAAIALYFVNEKKEQIKTLDGEIEGLNASITQLQAEVDKRPELEAELEKIEENLNEYIKILPSAKVATPERLQELVQDKLDRASVQISSYIRSENRSKAKSRSAFQEIGLTLQAEGEYDNFISFLNSLERHETFLRVNSFTCSPQAVEEDGRPIESPRLRITLNVSTFRYQPSK